VIGSFKARFSHGNELLLFFPPLVAWTPRSAGRLKKPLSSKSEQ
jgi:hypothetical protein